MKKSDSKKRIFLLALNIMSLFLYTGLYAYSWFTYYYPVINNFNQGIRLYVNGHILIIALYFIILCLFSRTYGSLKIGYLKPGDVIFSQIFSLLGVNLITFAQISLMHNWLVAPPPLLKVFGLQLLIAVLWAFICDRVYKKMFPPRRVLLVHGSRQDAGGDSVAAIVAKLSSRDDRFFVSKTCHINEGIFTVKAQSEDDCDAIMLWDIDLDVRSELLKYFYSKSKRVYLIPRITDVLVKGSDQIHLIDTPIFLTREYALTVEQRLAKRLVDIAFSFLLIIITSPIMLLLAIAVRTYDRGPALFRQLRLTAGGKEFWIVKFRSMRTDAESDGVARLAGRNDSRITPIGRFIRSTRLDELPQLFNILCGEMSFIGPRPERPELVAQHLEAMPEFAFRMKMKAGLSGYAQIHGKYNTTPYDKLKLDLTYIANYSLWLDLKLMLLTLRTLFRLESTEGV